MNPRVLFIGAHIDECEFGVGGTAYLLSQAGAKVRFLNVAAFLHYTPAVTSRELMQSQSDAAAAVLGVEKAVWPNTAGGVWVNDEEKVMRLTDEIEIFKPDILFIQAPHDNHYEHAEVARASYCAFSHASSHVHVKEVYAYEAGIYQTVQYFVPDFVVDIESVRDKVNESLNCFRQEKAEASSLLADKEAMTTFRGKMCFCRYAEAFKIVKFPDNGDDFMLRQMLSGKFRWAGNMQYPAFGREYF